jgi:hypothetical protein
MFLKKWREDEGGVDFIQLVTGLVIIAIACVSTYQALYFGYEQQDLQIRYRKALSIARSYAEYWQGRVHVDFPKAGEPSYRNVINGNQRTPLEVTLDTRDPDTDLDDIKAKIWYSPLTAVPMPTDARILSHWEWVVTIQWYEPGEDPANTDGKHPSSPKPREIRLFSAMAPADM